MRTGAVRNLLSAASLSLAALAAVPASAGPVVRADAALPAAGLNIVVFRPDVQVGAMKAGGVNEPNAEWTEAARTNLRDALSASPELAGADIKFVDELGGDDANLLTEYRGMFEIVAGAMTRHGAVAENALPGKGAGDWTLGEGAAQLRQATGADYALFLFSRDAYGDTGRKISQALSAVLTLRFKSAGIHSGHAGLVDLRTGDVVWFNTDGALGGDMRDADGAQERVRQLLAGFPVRRPVTVAAN